MRLLPRRTNKECVCTVQRLVCAVFLSLLVRTFSFVSVSKFRRIICVDPWSNQPSGPAAQCEGEHTMNFSAFGGPFSGIHQFAAKFGHDSQNGPFAASSAASMNTQEVHGNRYHANGNHFNQNSTSSKPIFLLNRGCVRLDCVKCCATNKKKTNKKTARQQNCGNLMESAFGVCLCWVCWRSGEKRIDVARVYRRHGVG